MKTLTSSCRPSQTSSTHLLPLALYHVVWRLPSSNLCWKSHHDKNLLKNYCPISKFPWKSRSPQTSLPSPRKQPQQPLSVTLLSRTRHRDHFVTCCKSYPLHSGQWQHLCSSFVRAFCSFWYYWPPNSPLTPEFCFWHSVYCTPMVSVISLRLVLVHFSQ